MKRAVSVLITVIIVTSLIAGCSNIAGYDRTESSRTQERPDKAVEITWWEYPNFAEIDGEPGAYEKTIIESFNKKYPDIKVNVEMLAYTEGPEKAATAIASNTQADFVYDFPGRIIAYARDNKMAKLNDMFTDTFKEEVPKTILDACSIGNDFYMYPFNTAPNMMAFNKTMLEKAGILDILPLKREDRLWTLEEYEKALKVIKNKIPGVIPAVFYCKTSAGDQGTRAFITNLFGGETIDGRLSAYRLNEPGPVKALEWLGKSIDEGLFIKENDAITANDAIEMFTQEKAASTILYSGVLKRIYASKKVSNFEEVFVPIPSPGKPRLEAFIGGMGVFNNASEKVAAAKKFIDFMCNDPEWVKKNLFSTGGLSVRKSITGLYDDPELKFTENMVPYIGVYYNHVPGFADMRILWVEALRNIAAGKDGPQKAMDDFVRRADETLKK